MSKSKGNVVNPDELVANYGSDTIRMYELFVGPPEVDSEWSDRGIEGVYKFLRRAWDWIVGIKDACGETDHERIARELHILTYKVTDRLESFKFNTAISAFMEFLNAVTDQENKDKKVSKAAIETFIILLAPFAPHAAEEMWQLAGHAKSVFEAKWPTYDKDLIVSDMIELPVQVNGKLRGTLTIERDAGEEEIFAKALEVEGVKRHTAGKTIKKKLYVKGKIVTLVIG
jgi:leucyl-tRNA synthetase